MIEPEKSTRPNRDAFHALLIVSALFALFLVALIIAAWNTRIAFMPLVPKTPAPAAALRASNGPSVQKAFLLSAPRYDHAAPQSNPPAGVRKAFGGFTVTRTSDAAAYSGSRRTRPSRVAQPIRDPSCRPAQNFHSHV